MQSPMASRLAPRLHPRSFTFTPIAETGPRFRDFAPYVAALDDAGTVAFQATLTTGGSGVFTASGGPITTVASGSTSAAGAMRPMSPPETVLRDVISHPDIGNDGSVCFYAECQAAGDPARRHHSVVLVKDGEHREMARGAGPLGPTMNDRGAVAFRADVAPGISGVLIARGHDANSEPGSPPPVTVADTRGHFTGFHGLPVIDRQGVVVFRADTRDGGSGIYAWNQGTIATVVATMVSTGGASAGAGPSVPHSLDPGLLDLRSLARFPAIDDHGTVVFAATRASGLGGIFAVRDGQLTAIVDGDSGRFASFRGALVDDSGALIFFANPPGGELGVYCGPDPVAHRVFAIGAPLGDHPGAPPVRSFALNPVSINRAGQLAIRLELADGQQAIVRADPR